MDTKYDDFEAARTDHRVVAESKPFRCGNGAAVTLLHQQDNHKSSCFYCIKDAYTAQEGVLSRPTQYSSERQLTEEEVQRCVLEQEGECWEPDAN